MSRHGSARLPPLLPLTLLLTLPASITVNAAVGTFNVTNVVSISINESSSLTSSFFELRTSHSAWAVWGLSATRPGGVSLRLAIELGNLTAFWDTGSSVISTGISDGNWHSVRVQLLPGNDSALVGIDSAPSVELLNISSSILNASSLIVTFGGINGTGGLRGCLANASVDDGFASSTVANLTGGCRVDPCACANSGRCLQGPQWNLPGGCDCNGTGLHGPLCLDFCFNASGCSGNGACVGAGAGANCSCQDGWLGARCQAVDPCGHGACSSRGNCSRLGDPDLLPGNLSRLCDCQTGFAGLDCNATVSVTAAPTSPPADTRIVVGLVVGILLTLLVGTAIGLTVKVLRDRRRDTGVYKPSDRELGGNSAQGMRSVLHPPTEERLI